MTNRLRIARAGRPVKARVSSVPVVCGRPQPSPVERRHAGLGATQKGRAELGAARPESESRRNPSSIGDTPRGNYRNAHGIDDLRDQRNRTDRAGSGTAAEAAAMTAGLEPLRDDNVGAACFERAGLGYGRGRTEDDAPGLLHPPHY
jgi:hypothetical protein